MSLRSPLFSPLAYSFPLATRRHGLQYADEEASSVRQPPLLVCQSSEQVRCRKVCSRGDVSVTRKPEQSEGSCFPFLLPNSSSLRFACQHACDARLACASTMNASKSLGFRKTPSFTAGVLLSHSLSSYVSLVTLALPFLSSRRPVLPFSLSLSPADAAPITS